MKTVDAINQPCPKPIILAKKALMEEPSKPFNLLLNNLTSRENVERYLNDNQIPFFNYTKR
jgi:TusA-related sulfurtransferase